MYFPPNKYTVVLFLNKKKEINAGRLALISNLTIASQCVFMKEEKMF